MNGILTASCHDWPIGRQSIVVACRYFTKRWSFDENPVLGVRLMPNAIQSKRLAAVDSLTVPEPSGDRDGLRQRLYHALLDSNRLFAESLLEPIEVTMNKFTQILVDQLGVKLVFIGIVCDGDDRVRIKAVAGEAAGYADGLQISIDPLVPEGLGPFGMTLRSGEPMVSDMEIDANCSPWRERARAFGLGGCASAPFGPVSGVRGVVTMYRGSDQRFPEEANDLLARLAQDIAIFLGRRATELDLIRTRAIYRALLNEGELVLDALDERTLLDETCNRLIASGLFVSTWISRPSEDGSFTGLAHADVGLRASSANDLHAVRDSLAEHAWRTREPQYFYDKRTGNERDPWDDRAEDGFGSGVSIPIVRAGVPWAILTFACAERDVMTGEFAALLVHVARYLGHALDEVDLKARLVSEVAQEAWLAEHDALTGLPNRRALATRLDLAIERLGKSRAQLAIGIFDLDDFKALNDEQGHASGDVLLQTIAKRLSDALERTDFIARLGGDEFVFVFEEVADRSDLVARLDRVERAIAVPIVLSDHLSVAIRGSFGLTFIPRDSATDAPKPSAFLHQADRALHDLKADKTHRQTFWKIFSESVDPPQPRKGHAAYVSGLLRGGGLRVAYQPIVALPSGAIVGIEALARLEDPAGTLLQPSAFLRQFDLDDQFVLTQGVLERALADIGDLDARGTSLWVSINVAPEVVSSDRFYVMLRDLIHKYRCEPSRIALEILEQSDFLPMDSLGSTRQRLTALKELGVRLALDDVGSAYSSLLRLKELPIDKFKLDRAFVHSLADTPEALHFVDVLLDLARNLRVDFIAEGVESLDVADALAALQVPFIQGYAIARPMLLDALVAWIAAYRPKPWLQTSTILGLYARNLHLSKMRRMELTAAARQNAEKFANDADHCDVGRSIALMGLLGGSIDDGHRRFHETYTAALAGLRADGRLNWDALNRDEIEYRETLLRALQAK